MGEKSEENDSELFTKQVLKKMGKAAHLFIEKGLLRHTIIQAFLNTYFQYN
jgi:hypothetical protein